MAEPITDPQEHNNPQAWNNLGAVDNVPVDGDANQDNQRILPRQTPSGVSRGIQQLGGPSLQADSGKKQITVTDTVPRVLMGNQPTFGEGLYVSKPGVDVTTATNLSDFISNSNQNQLKIVKTDVVNFSASSGTTSTLALPHDLGFTPIALAYLPNVSTFPPVTGASLGLPTFLTASIGGVTAGVVSFGSYLYCVADETKVYIQCLNASGGSLGVFQVRYYLLQETSGTGLV